MLILIACVLFHEITWVNEDYVMVEVCKCAFWLAVPLPCATDDATMRGKSTIIWKFHRMVKNWSKCGFFSSNI